MSFVKFILYCDSEDAAIVQFMYLTVPSNKCII